MDVDLLQRSISYDPSTGSLTWKKRTGEGKEVKRWNSRYAGRPAFNCISSSGHITGTFKKKHIKAHRAAWAIFHGIEPHGEIDHANGNPSDNRICNLREATRVQNAQNVPKRKGGLSRYRGVSKCGDKWCAIINNNGKRTHLGSFSTEEEAAIGYDLAASIMHGNFARPNLVNDRDAVTAFIEEYVRRNHKSLFADARIPDGVRIWTDKAAF